MPWNLNEFYAPELNAPELYQADCLLSDETLLCIIENRRVDRDVIVQLKTHKSWF